MDANDRDLREFVDALAPEQRAALCGLLDLPPRTGVRGICERAVERWSTKDGALGLLTALQDQDQADLLLCWALRGEQGLARARARLGTYTRDAAVPAVHGPAGAALGRRGLCVPLTGDALAVLPVLVEPLAATCLRAQLDDLRECAGSAPELAFCLALAIGLVAAERLLVRADGELHSASLKRLEKRVGQTGLAGMDPEAAFHTLQRLGALARREQGNTRALHVVIGMLAPILALPGPELARRALWQQGLHQLELWTYARLRLATGRDRARGAPPGAVPLAAIVATRLPGPRSYGTWNPLEAPDPWDVTQSMKTLVLAGLVDLAEGEGEVLFRPRVEDHKATGRAVVQPSFEVLVPWDAPPLAVARLGLTADLEQTDRVCRYRLTPESVRRGVESLGGAQEILEVLEELSAGSVPQNVRVTVRGWAGEQRPIRPVKGDLLIAEPTQVAALLRIAPQALEVAPGVLLLPGGTLAATIDAARRAGLPMAAPLQRAEEATAPPSWTRSGRSDLDEARRYLDGAVKEADPPEPTSTTTDAPRKAARKPSLRELLDAFGVSLPDIDLARLGLSEADLFAADDDEDEGEGSAPTRRTRSVEAPAVTTPNPRGKPAWFPDGDDTPGASPPGEPVPRPPTWTPVLPGQLRTLLDAAIEGGTALRLMFHNAEGRSVDRRIVPLRIRRTPKGGEVLEAHDEQHRGTCTLVLDRILAVAKE